MKLILSLLIFSFLGFLPVGGFAAKRVPPQETKKVIRYKKRTKIKLDRSLIDGDLLDPARIEVTLSPKRQFKSLLKPRTDFLDELKQDMRQIR